MKVKGEGRNCELVECAMCRRVSAWAYLRVRGKLPTAGLSERRYDFAQKGVGFEVKGVENRKKVHKFLYPHPYNRKIKPFYLVKLRKFEIK